MRLLLNRTIPVFDLVRDKLASTLMIWLWSAGDLALWSWDGVGFVRGASLEATRSIIENLYNCFYSREVDVASLQ